MPKHVVSSIYSLTLSVYLGLDGDMIDALANDEELQCILKLHDFVQSVKEKQYNNKKQIGELGEMFKELNVKIQTVQKD